MTFIRRNESIPQPSDIYDKGDLGFDPEYIDLEAFDLKPELPVEETTDKIIEDYLISDVPSQVCHNYLALFIY